MVGPMVRPRHVLNSINSSAEEIGKENSNFHLEIIENFKLLETLRSYELNDEYSKFKSYSLDPFPDCQMKKRLTDSYRKQHDFEETTEPTIKTDCNGGVNFSQSQRSDHIPLLVNTNRKRWHSLEMVGSADVGGCEEELVDRNSKKSLGRSQMIKKWLVEFFQSSNGLKGSTRNGSGILLQQTTVANQKTKPEETSIV